MTMALTTVRDVRDDASDLVRILRQENHELRQRLSEAERDVARARDEATSAVSALRQQLSPLYKALRMVFGEMDAISDEGASTHSTNTVWEQWKQKLDKGSAKVIDALLTHKRMTRRQIAVATGYSPQNISNIISKLNKASLVTKDGDLISLRSL